MVGRLVLQAPAGRQWAPDAKPAGGVVGLDTPPPGQLTCRWLPHDCLGRGRLSLALDWGRLQSLIALAQVVLLTAAWRPIVDWLRQRGGGIASSPTTRHIPSHPRTSPQLQRLPLYHCTTVPTTADDVVHHTLHHPPHSTYFTHTTATLHFSPPHSLSCPIPHHSPHQSTSQSRRSLHHPPTAPLTTHINPSLNIIGRPEIYSEGGGGGGREPQDCVCGGGGLRKWAPKSRSYLCLRSPRATFICFFLI